ncbi:MAG: serine hydrolase, partial [Rubrobacter sp.]|nr:serine hydrolase [Rubrobacter sp.]
MNDSGLSEARLGRMRETMAGHIERGHVSGIVTLISRRDKVHVDIMGTKSLGG